MDRMIRRIGPIDRCGVKAGSLVQINFQGTCVAHSTTLNSIWEAIAIDILDGSNGIVKFIIVSELLYFTEAKWIIP